MNRDRVRLPDIISARITKKMLLQKGKCLAFPKTVKRSLFEPYRFRLFHTALSGNPRQCCHRMLTHPKHLAGIRITVRIFSVIDGYCHDHISGKPHKLRKQSVLHRSKSGKSIQHDHTPLQQFRFWHCSAQHIQNFLFGNISVLEIFPKLLIYKAHIL